MCIRRHPTGKAVCKFKACLIHFFRIRLKSNGVRTGKAPHSKGYRIAGSVCLRLRGEGGLQHSAAACSCMEEEHITRINPGLPGRHWAAPQLKKFQRLRNSSTILICTIGLALCTFGCSTYYYQVTDLNTGKLYYTEDMYQKNGTLHLKDGKTGNAVTLQNSDVREITKEDFETRRVQP